MKSLLTLFSHIARIALMLELLCHMYCGLSLLDVHGWTARKRMNRSWRTLTPSDEYDRMRCGLMPNYLDHLLNFYVIVLSDG